MKELLGKVAVVTGAGSGIGLALARAFAAQGMKVVLADIERESLARAAAELEAAGATCLAVRTDVSQLASVEALAAAARETFGAVHVVCNNAGVGGTSDPLWALSQADWDWTLGVNLWGIIHGVRVFVPLLLAQGEGHVVNVASIAGLTTNPYMGPYCASKHAVVAISEVLAKELSLTGAAVKVSVVCPGWVRTAIADSERNRPEHLRNPPTSTPPGAALVAGAVRHLVEGGVAPESVAEQVVAAVRQERFYVLTHPEMKRLVRRRDEEILDGRAPSIDPVVAKLFGGSQES